MSGPVLVIHGGAGTLNRLDLSPELEREFRENLRNILVRGRESLAAGASALDVVEQAVVMFEDCPLFNAGRGSVYTSAETHEMDASIMDGTTLNAGTVCCVHGVRNPIRAARIVMEKSPHVMMSGEGAMNFLRTHGVDFEPEDYFASQWRLGQLREARGINPHALILDHDGSFNAAGRMESRGMSFVGASLAGAPLDEKSKMGTVGAVCLDAAGRLAAATSTGGMTNKLPGRVGDTPIVGAGCYANGTAAVSCTGTGETFIRVTAGREVAARVAYLGEDIETAGRHVLQEVGRLGGTGGLIAVDADGNMAMPFISEGMYRGFVRPGEEPFEAIYKK